MSASTIRSNNEGFRFCGVKESLLEEARRRQAAWRSKRRLRWYLADRLAGIPLNALTAAYAQAYANWQSVCGLVFEQTMTSSDADIVVLARRIDGSGGTLAEHELPMGDDRQLRGWYDVGESWTTTSPPGGKIDLVAVACHETGHGIGLSHTTVPGNLLNPYYDPAIRTPQQWDIAEARDRYGPPVEEPTPTAPSVPPGAILDQFSGLLEMPFGVYTATFTKTLL
ncbi:matrixin family metalloprotease [Lacipirellula parvula]|uniref:Peptidase metallopeptidase domain-containing protein n=1 Tax=Lacipirellula parvula TaxID=2650471 RepID=A0A5K7X327_9BACT|nr:matrixin family metalloprotease [Lacipirellula parvula]BBO31058.1 hypothetical protein PLANPX_0670 [Lacipirellula parvula]